MLILYVFVQIKTNLALKKKLSNRSVKNTHSQKELKKNFI